MTPSERRTARIRLLAKIDQEITEAEFLASSPLLDPDERRYAQVQLDFRRKAVERVEAMLRPTPSARPRRPLEFDP
jgi:hypothetical protein